MKHSLLCFLFILINIQGALAGHNVDWEKIYEGEGARRLTRESFLNERSRRERERLLDRRECESNCCSCIRKPFLMLWGCILKRKSKVKA